MTTSDIEQLPEDAKPEVKWRRVWFLYVWTGLLGGWAGFSQLSGADQDAKNFSLLIAGILWVIGASIWFMQCSPFSRKIRWSVGLAPWVLVFAFFFLVELVNNGDVGIVGWRWRLAAEPDEQLQLPASSARIEAWNNTPQDYPRFLGNGYWAEVSGVKLQTDWENFPPRELWRKKIGAGWSAFSIVGNYAVTQEQRGPNELVTCYDIRTGDLIWSHADEVRYDEGGRSGLGGIGPRATPSIYKQRVLSLGATGILNCLDANDGELIWSHDTLAENDAANIMWGKACSPLVVARADGREMVVASVGGKNGRSLVAYDLETGSETWAGGDYRSSYASPIFAELLGQGQILSMNENFLTAHHLESGEVLWEYPWEGDSDTNATVPQPVPLSEDRIFLSKGYGIGCSLLQLTRDEDDAIQATPMWPKPIKTVMKTKMCNIAVRDGYIYGLDNGIMQCIAIESGKNQWKKRRTPPIGHGQIMLIGDVILAITESGELLLIEPSSKKYRELAAIQALDREKITWNNPAFAAPYLLVRNAEEVACYELPLVEGTEVAGEPAEVIGE